MYIPKCICTSVLLFYCPPRPAQKDYFPTRPFLKTKKNKRRDTKTLRLFEHEKNFATPYLNLNVLKYF